LHHEISTVQKRKGESSISFQPSRRRAELCQIAEPAEYLQAAQIRGMSRLALWGIALRPAAAPRLDAATFAAGGALPMLKAAITAGIGEVFGTVM
jgi:hypothetical protein